MDTLRKYRDPSFEWKSEHRNLREMCCLSERKWAKWNMCVIQCWSRNSSKIRIRLRSCRTESLVVFRSDAREELKNKRGLEYSYPVLAFHGTAIANIQPICETGFKVPGEFDCCSDKSWMHWNVHSFRSEGVQTCHWHWLLWPRNVLQRKSLL